MMVDYFNELSTFDFIFIDLVPCLVERSSIPFCNRVALSRIYVYVLTFNVKKEKTSAMTMVGLYRGPIMFIEGIRLLPSMAMFWACDPKDLECHRASGRNNA